VSTTRGRRWDCSAGQPTAEDDRDFRKTPAVTLSTNLITLNPGASTGITVALTGFGFASGLLRQLHPHSGREVGRRVARAVWYGVASGVPANIRF